jgi:hypothetical protein
VLAYGYQLLAQLTSVKTMLLLRRDRLRLDEIRPPLKESTQRIVEALTRPGTAPLEAREPSDETPSKLPDPFEQDLSPWLLRRLRMATGLAQSLRAEAARVA